MKYDNALTLRWTHENQPITVKEPINKIWLQEMPYKCKGLKKMRLRLLFPTELVYAGRSVAYKRYMSRTFLKR